MDSNGTAVSLPVWVSSFKSTTKSVLKLEHFACRTFNFTLGLGDNQINFPLIFKTNDNNQMNLPLNIFSLFVHKQVHPTILPADADTKFQICSKAQVSTQVAPSVDSYSMLCLLPYRIVDCQCCRIDIVVCSQPYSNKFLGRNFKHLRGLNNR